MSNQCQSTIFAMSQTDGIRNKGADDGCTLRIVLWPNADVESFEIQFSNLTGVEPILVGQATLALCKEDGTLDNFSTVPVTVKGKTSFLIGQGCDVTSDKIQLPVCMGQYVALSIYYPKGQKLTAGNWISNRSRYSKKGDYTSDISFPQLKSKAQLKALSKAVIVTDFTVFTNGLFQVIANVKKPRRAIACFGDSITQQCAWTAPLEKILSLTYPGEVSLLNLGISGNRLLYDGSYKYERHGVAGIKRFSHDLLQLKGLTHAIIGIGSNDIGLPGTAEAPMYEIITLQEYIVAMEKMANILHTRKVKVYASTILPRPINKSFTQEREKLRKEINNWIKQATCFDAVIDFDKVMRENMAKSKKNNGLYLPDGLHPSLKGGLCMAQSVDTSLFK